MENLNAIVAQYVLDTAERGEGETLAERFVSGASQEDADRERSSQLMDEAGVTGDDDAEEGIRRVCQGIWDRACGSTIDSVDALIAGLV